MPNGSRFCCGAPLDSNTDGQNPTAPAAASAPLKARSARGRSPTTTVLGAVVHAPDLQASTPGGESGTKPSSGASTCVRAQEYGTKGVAHSVTGRVTNYATDTSACSGRTPSSC